MYCMFDTSMNTYTNIMIISELRKCCNKQSDVKKNLVLTSLSVQSPPSICRLFVHALPEYEMKMVLA